MEGSGNKKTFWKQQKYRIENIDRRSWSHQSGVINEKRIFLLAEKKAWRHLSKGKNEITELRKMLEEIKNGHL